MSARAGYEKGLREVGDGAYAYLQPDGGWGWSNAGLVVDGERTLLVDTLYDLALTEEMLRTMRRSVPAAAQIDTLVNTHANGDHCYGNQLVGDARIVASEQTAAEMPELPPQAMAAMLGQAAEMGELGAFFARTRAATRSCTCRPSGCCSAATSCSRKRTRSRGRDRCRTGSRRVSVSLRWTWRRSCPDTGH